VQHIIDVIPTILAISGFIFVILAFRSFVNKSLNEYNGTTSFSTPGIQIIIPATVQTGTRQYDEFYNNPVYSNITGNSFNTPTHHN